MCLLLTDAYLNSFLQMANQQYNSGMFDVHNLSGLVGWAESCAQESKVTPIVSARLVKRESYLHSFDPAIIL